MVNFFWFSFLLTYQMVVILDSWQISDISVLWCDAVSILSHDLYCDVPKNTTVSLIWNTLTFIFLKIERVLKCKHLFFNKNLKQICSSKTSYISLVKNKRTQMYITHTLPYAIFGKHTHTHTRQTYTVSHTPLKHTQTYRFFFCDTHTHTNCNRQSHTNTLCYNTYCNTHKHCFINHCNTNCVTKYLFHNTNCNTHIVPQTHM